MEVNPKSINGINSMTVLHYLVYENDSIFRKEIAFAENADLVKFLIDNGANVNAKDFQERTPVSYTVRFFCHPKTAKIFLENGAVINREKLLKEARGRVSNSIKRLRRKYTKKIKNRKKNCEDMVKLLESAQKKS